MAMKFHNKKVYLVPGNAHHFRTKHDAQYFCEQHGIDFSQVEIYDSEKELSRWRELQEEEKNGKITNLQRQVEFEIIPAHYEDKTVRYKKVKIHSAEGNDFPTKTQARTWCKSRGIPYSRITTFVTVEPVVKSVCIEQNAVYTADFVYVELGEMVVEDVKSEATRREPDYVLRRKLMLHVHGIKILET